MPLMPSRSLAKHGAASGRRFRSSQVARHGPGAGERPVLLISSLAKFEGVVVRDDDFGAVDVRQHVGRNEVAVAVVALRVVRLEDSQAVPDRDPRRDHQETPAVEVASRCPDIVDGLPGDQHGHDGGLAAAGGHFQGGAGANQGLGCSLAASQPLSDSVVAALARRATSVSQMAVSTASTYGEERPDALPFLAAPVGQ